MIVANKWWWFKGTHGLREFSLFISGNLRFMQQIKKIHSGYVEMICHYCFELAEIGTAHSF